MSASLFGFVNLNKPAGWSSRKAVDHVKRLVKPAKIGHAGTLDPLATGVLVLCIGPATRLVPYVHDASKSYTAEFRLGFTSPSDDTEGDVQPLEDATVPTRDRIDAALPRFIGETEQIPPAFSAVKIRGKRAYELARRGKSPDLEPRLVIVESIQVLEYEYPQLVLEIVCGSGTYIRSIGRDLAEFLGTGAVMSQLMRTAVGPFTLETSVCPDEVTAESLPRCLQPPQDGLVGMPQIAATDETLEQLQRGLSVPCPPSEGLFDGNEVAILNKDCQLLLIATVTRGGTELKPQHVFVAKRGPLRE